MALPRGEGTTYRKSKNVQFYDVAQCSIMLRVRKRSRRSALSLCLCPFVSSPFLFGRGRFAKFDKHLLTLHAPLAAYSVNTYRYTVREIKLAVFS